MTKKHMIIGLLTTSLLLTGCGNDAVNSLNNTSDQLAISQVNTSNNAATSGMVDTDDTVTINKEDTQYEVIGKIVAFGENEVHVITGDIANSYPVSPDDLSRFYLGETVMVQKELEDMYSLLPYEADLTQRYTTMGQAITRQKMTLIEMSDKQLVFTVDAETITFENHLTQTLTVDNSYTIDYVAQGPAPYIVNVFDDTAAIEMTIQGLSRSDEGQLVIEAIGADGTVTSLMTYQALLNCQFDDLAIDQIIRVYPGNDPALPERIDLISQVAKGHVSITHDIIGEVIQLDQNSVHILSGDMADIFTVDEASLQAIYLGETVRLYMDNGKLKIEPYLIDDFSNDFTNMGQRITSFEGTVTDISKEEDHHLITINSEGDVTLTYYGQELPIIDEHYLFESVNFTPDETSLLTFYNTRQIIDVTVSNISRTPEGAMLISATDPAQGEYVINLSNVKVDFNLSELTVEDQLRVYADAIMESWPMQVQTRRISKK